MKTDDEKGKHGGSEEQTRIQVEAYGAYLWARASGTIPRRRSDADPTLFEAYAVSLGVRHYFRGKGPIPMADLLERAELACDGGTDGDRVNELVEEFLRVADAVDEAGRLGFEEPTADAAVRLIRSAKRVRDEERRACAEWLRKWPNAGVLVLASQIEQGAHVFPQTTGVDDYLGPTPPDPGISDLGARLSNLNTRLQELVDGYQLGSWADPEVMSATLAKSVHPDHYPRLAEMIRKRCREHNASLEASQA